MHMLWLTWVFTFMGIWLVLSPTVLSFSNENAILNSVIVGSVAILIGFFSRLIISKNLPSI